MDLPNISSRSSKRTLKSSDTTKKFTNISDSSTSRSMSIFLTTKSKFSSSPFRSHLCGYDINLTYPQTGGPIPGPALQLPTERDVPFFMSSAKNKNRLALSKQNFMSELSSRYAEKEANEGARSVDKRFRDISQRQWKRDLSGRAQDGTIDSWYGCLLLDEFLDYALNFTFPWSKHYSFIFDILYRFRVH